MIARRIVNSNCNSSGDGNGDKVHADDRSHSHSHSHLGWNGYRNSSKSKCEELIFPQYSTEDFPAIEMLDLKQNKWIRPQTTGSPPRVL